ncbi:MAG: hypothetical protein IJO48_02460, partial [Clostridia bacterium]|nr:hypothetical protein [Clostridia bacterium]
MKKALSIMLSLMMVLSMLPVAASAESASSELTHVSMLNASVRYSKFIERNGDIPLYVTADTQRLSIQDYLYSAADAILDLANGSRISAAYKALRTIDESTVRENITRGELKRGEYVALAKAVIEAVNSASAVPSCFGTSLGAISPKNTAYVFAQILEYYKGNRTLPSAVEVSPWSGTSYKAPEKAPKAVGTVETTIDIPEVFSAASRVKNRIDSNGILPTITEVDGQNLTMAQFLTTAVDAYLSGKVEGVMAASYANIPEYPVENMSASLTLNKAQIDSLVDAIDK